MTLEEVYARCAGQAPLLSKDADEDEEKHQSEEGTRCEPPKIFFRRAYDETKYFVIGHDVAHGQN